MGGFVTEFLVFPSFCTPRTLRGVGDNISDAVATDVAAVFSVPRETMSPSL